MSVSRPGWALATIGLLILSCSSRGESHDQKVLESDSLSLTVQRRGAIISNLQLKGDHLNWLLKDYQKSEGLYAHYLCFDRWGAVSNEEQKRGLSYHGEAVQQIWDRKPAAPDQETLNVTLPVVGLSAERSVALTKEGSVFAITNHFTNPTATARYYNAVEHITLSKNGYGPDTRLSSNATHGMVLHKNKLATEEAFHWPYFELSGQTWDARQGANVKGHSSTSWVFPHDEEWGWVSVENTATGELLGYIWPTSDYPWLILWSRYQNGRIIARALEPGTTALSLPHAELAKREPMLGQPLVNHLQPGEARRHRMWGFLVKLPPQSSGVSSVKIEDNHLIITLAADQTALKLSLP